MIEIKPEWKRAWQWSQKFNHLACKEHDLSDAVVNVLATALELEFGTNRCWDNPDWDSRFHCNDPRHTWTRIDWVAEAKRRLEQ